MINSALSGTGGFVFGGWALLTKVSERPMTPTRQSPSPTIICPSANHQLAHTHTPNPNPVILQVAFYVPTPCMPKWQP